MKQQKGPRCPFCGEEHYGLCPKIGADKAVAERKSTGPESGPLTFSRAAVPDAVRDGSGSGGRPKRGKAAGCSPGSDGKSERGKFDRVAYQREYMRRRRATGKS